MALDSQFAQTHFRLRRVHRRRLRDTTAQFRVVRYREVDGRLGERVVLLDRVPAATRPSAALGIGPDGRALCCVRRRAASTGRRAALASYNGKILRLSSDGTTPKDQPAGLPSSRAIFSRRAALDWDPLDRRARGRRREAAQRRRASHHRAVRRRLVVHARRESPLPAGGGAAAVAFYRGTLLPALKGDLFVAAEEGRYLLRLRFDRRDPPRLVSSERLLQDVGSPIQRRHRRGRRRLRRDRSRRAAVGSALGQSRISRSALPEIYFKS